MLYDGSKTNLLLIYAVNVSTRKVLKHTDSAMFVQFSSKKSMEGDHGDFIDIFLFHSPESKTINKAYVTFPKG